MTSTTHPASTLDALLGALREDPLPRMSRHEACDKALLNALVRDDPSDALSALFSGASLLAPVPPELQRQGVQSIEKHAKKSGWAKNLSWRLLDQFTELKEASTLSSFDPISWTSSRGMKMIHLCAVADQADAVMALVNAGAPINDLSDSLRTPLSFAAEHDAHRVVAQLLKDPKVVQEIDRQDQGGGSPLIWSVLKNAFMACDALLNAGANPHLKDGTGWSALHTAASNKQLELCLLLMRHDARLDSPANDEKTPLDWAISCGHHELASQLVEFDKARSAMKAIDRMLEKSTSPSSLANP